MVYFVRGVYSFRGDENPYSGIFTIEKNLIIGWILDYTSQSPLHRVKGKVTHSDGKISLKFVKRPESSLLIPIIYNLEKPAEGGIPGRYEGLWKHQEPGIELDIGYERGIGEIATISRVESTNKTRLVLDSKI
ncbi:MAG: hypothetical protein HYW26_02110 [Candidatus Aenigmarchaeota archaeon]|nr:hypothetical protein [Candidatus Aenigmarchaeota archaeon]